MLKAIARRMLEARHDTTTLCQAVDARDETWPAVLIKRFSLSPRENHTDCMAVFYIRPCVSVV